MLKNYTFIENGPSDNTKHGVVIKLHSPVSFDEYVPWMALQLELPLIIQIIRFQKEKSNEGNVDRSMTSSRSIKSLLCSKEESAWSFPLMRPSKAIKDTSILPICAYYDKNKKLIEIKILPIEHEIPRKLMTILSSCLPFHPELRKLSLCRSNINSNVLRDIGKLLPYSKLTEILLDGTFVAEGNYFVLLENTSSLKYLSLSRCKINSKICQCIASNLHFGCPAEKTLRVLDLASNYIGDNGAKYLGTALRSNRSLLHLNISDNQITDKGANFILDDLMQFPLTYDEIIERRKKYIEWLKNEKYFITRLNRADETLDDDRSPFSFKNTLIKDGYVYCLGNMALCSLSVAYNNLEYNSLQKLVTVLHYQSFMKGDGSGTGLLRVGISGNRIPISCPEFNNIRAYLEQACLSRGSVVHKLTHPCRRLRYSQKTLRSRSFNAEE